ncbi:anti-sigma factor RsbA family regulatory protein [Streptosporangium sp. NPDC050855]|uniref:anti-sigma factor RsbA family regulatory protein n=1 Tax=Streptosporangium sp. NPDC050855 TaxID=3366194 RepID=UPI00378A8D2B
MSVTTAETEPFVHPALFYRGDRDYLEGTVPFILEGLKAGEPVAVAVPARNLALIRDELGEVAPQDAEVLFVDMEQAGRNPGRIIPAVLWAFTDLHPGRRVRVVGEPIWPDRSPTEYVACLQHEALINLAFSGRDVTILCPYDADGLDPEIIRHAEETHPVIIDGTDTRASTGYAPERVIRDCGGPLPEPAGAETLAFGADDLWRVRAFAVAYADGIGLAGERLEDLRLIASELAANSLEHGGGSGVARIWTEDRRIVFDVSDTGHIADPLAGRRPADSRQRGSRGLLVTNLLGDLVRVHTERGRTTVRVYFDVP